MVYDTKKLIEPLKYEHKHLDIIEGIDPDTGEYSFDVVYHNTDLGIMGIRASCFAHIRSSLTNGQLRLLMKSYAEMYVRGYETAKEDE